MERWQNRVAVVTGASSGIGATIAVDLVNAGMIVAGLARRVDHVEALRAKLPENLRGNIHAVKCDVTSDNSVTDAFDWIDKNLGGVDVLVNNAGIAKFGQALNMNIKDMEYVMQTNFFGVLRCTRRAFKSMQERKFDGHVLVINSVVGHRVVRIPAREPRTNVYSPSKFAVTALCQILKQEFQWAKTQIKITSVSPGLTNTELISDELRKLQPIRAEDVSEAVLYAIGTPQTVQVVEVTVEPVKSKF